MILDLVEKHKSLAKDKPHVVTAWLSMMAFDDMSMFAKSMDVTSEQLIQSLMYRLKYFQLFFRSTDTNQSQKNLEVGGILIAVSKNKLFIFTKAKNFINAFVFSRSQKRF